MDTERSGPALFDVVSCLSKAVDLVCPAVTDHHIRVAFMARTIAQELGFTEQGLADITLAGMLHDVGVLSLTDDLGEFHFDMENPHLHAALGYSLLRDYRPLAGPASIILHHHVAWEGGRGMEFSGKETPLASHVLHLAERVAGLINEQAHMLGQADMLRALARANSGTIFHPLVVEAYMQASSRECFWLAIASRRLTEELARTQGLPPAPMGTDSLLGLTRLLSQVIDFRSPYTFTHSSGVAAVAETMGRLMGLELDACADLEIAGFVHDLGKVGTPRSILEKPGRLTQEEFNIVKAHSYHSYAILSGLPGFAHIAEWAGQHHERPSGKGYPFHLHSDELHVPARILQSADVFTAVTEDRPYRLGMDGPDALHVLREMAAHNGADRECVALLESRFDDVNDARIQAQRSAAAEYKAVNAD